MGRLERCTLWMKRRKECREEVRAVKVGKENSSRYPSNKIVTSKYTLWNFIPKNLFEQFRRIANFYFLAIIIISYVVDGPVGSTTSILPLAFVVLVTAVKQGYEDLVRHRADRELNNAVVWVLRNACLQKIPSQKIRVGDIVKLCENEDAPCDLVLLTSSQESSKCYVTTSGLDGETNIKTLYCPRSLKRNIKTENLKFLDAQIECEHPTPDLYKFNGRIEFSKMTSELIKRNSFRRQTYQSKRTGAFSGNSIVFPSSVSNGSLPNGGSEKSVSSDVSATPSNTDDFPSNLQNFRSKNSSSPQLGRPEPLHREVFGQILSHSNSEPKRHLTLPKRSFQKHQKTFSNVTNVSWDPSFFESLENLKWMSKRRGSEKDNLVDPLTAENLLLKGSTLKNTEFVYGCAVYTGQETKMALNSKLTRTKFSVAEKSINKFLMFQLGLLILESLASTILNRTIRIKHHRKKFDAVFMEDDVDETNELSFSRLTMDFFLFILIYNYLIPISLYVTLELTKFLGALLFTWDLSMYDDSSEQSAVSNTSDVNEELGVVEYLFTDKTGTLTENNLRFHSCSIDGVAYQEKDGELYKMEENATLAESPTATAFDSCSNEMRLFLLALTLCNTVQVIVENDAFRYSATSPDEKALVEAMQRMKIAFANDDDFVVVNVAGNTKIFQKLEVLEFSSSRKRMSVIVKDEEETIRLYCKGAESALIPKVISGPTEDTLADVSNFARKGLRTLAVGYKVLTEEEYRTIDEKVQKARETLSSDREEVVTKTYEEIEDGLILLGATGVEDKLQDGVQDTLESLRDAGIKVWMLTGDKVETAVQISLSCGHFRSNARRLTLTEMPSSKDCEDAIHNIHSRLAESDGEEFCLVVDGKSLGYALESCSEEFRQVCMRCSAVICCRLSPIQKSQVVTLVKSRKRPPIVAAIGDGANDVSMLKEAHVGLGIMGKEGRQATMSSDFAFAKFRHVKRVLLVHGHWYYVRTANLVQYFFYKNIVFITPQFYFFFFSGYSVQQLYDSLFYVCYNTIFTSLPVLLYGVFEQNYPREELLRVPQLYHKHRRNVLLTWNCFALWMAFGLWHSLVVFFVPTLFYQLSPSIVAQNCIENFGTTIFHNSVILVNLKLLLHSRFWSVAFVASIIFSILTMFLVTIVYSSIYVPDGNSSYYMSFNVLIRSPNYWLLCVVIWVIALIPDVLFYVFINTKPRISNKKSLMKSSSNDGSTLTESVF